MREDRRTFLSYLAKVPLAARLLGWVAPPSASAEGTGASSADTAPNADTFDVVVVGSGFGGTMTALTLARAFKIRNKRERLLVLERGAWWTTPVETVQDKEIQTPGFLAKHRQPVRYWASADHWRGLYDVVTRCFRRKGQPDGVYELTLFNRAKKHCLCDPEPDAKLAVLSANGVGGGSLVYTNVTIEPPKSVFASWPTGEAWPPSGVATQHGRRIPQGRKEWYDLAREAIGFGVLRAWDLFEGVSQPYGAINTGLSNIVLRSPAPDLKPYAQVWPPGGPHPRWKPGSWVNDTGRSIVQFDPERYLIRPDPSLNPPHKQNTIGELWLDRPRVFQTTAARVLWDLNLPPDYGTVDSAINDKPSVKAKDADPAETLAKNYCERQGRCAIGCLPGARMTLNKQLMKATFGAPVDPRDRNPADYLVPPSEPNNEAPGKDAAADLNTDTYKPIDLRARCEVTGIEGEPGGPYTVTYVDAATDATKPVTVVARKVILAAGCVNTNAMLLKCKKAREDRPPMLPRLNDEVGVGFSNNGDFISFIEPTKEIVDFWRGPMTTSFAHFHTESSSDFHTIEDAGLPRMFSVLFGKGTAFVAGLQSKDVFKVIKAILQLLGTFFDNLFAKDQKEALGHMLAGEPTDEKTLRAEEIPSQKIIPIASMGREAAAGVIRLDDDGNLRIRRQDKGPSGQNLQYPQDPIYEKILATMDRFTDKVGDSGACHKTVYDGKFARCSTNPKELDRDMLLTTLHPMGGCRMASPPASGEKASGVVNQYGEVFGYPNLFVADASIIPASLGVNPSLTIAALSLRVAHEMIKRDYPLWPA